MDPVSQRHLKPGEDLSSLAQGLLRGQKEKWPLLRAGYQNLETVESRKLEFDGAAIRIQWNPGRLASTSARVDDRSVRERKCFLCPANLPPEQQGILLAADYLLLCNPFPIFREHFTISHTMHVPQRIAGSFGTMLDFAYALRARYTMVYNGPRCGASAPDHLHFQAGETGFMPIEHEYRDAVRKGTIMADDEGARVLAADDGLRRYFVLEGTDRGLLEGFFGALLDSMALAGEGGEEPMVNIIAFHAVRGWTVLVFPRAKHRPSFFFAEGEEKILLSPAAVDCGGVCITPVEKDFRRLTKDHIAQMFREVMLAPGIFQAICQKK